MKTVFSSILFSCSTPTADLSKEDKLRIATEVLRDDTLFQQLADDMAATYKLDARVAAVTQVNPPDIVLHPGFSGDSVPWSYVHSRHVEPPRKCKAPPHAHLCGVQRGHPQSASAGIIGRC